MEPKTALWGATRPVFRVPYMDDPASTPRVPLYASYGAAKRPTALAKLAPIVRKAPEVMVTTTSAARVRAAVARSASVLASMRSTTLSVAAGTTGPRDGIADDRIPASEAGARPGRGSVLPAEARDLVEQRLFPRVSPALVDGDTVARSGDLARAVPTTQVGPLHVLERISRPWVLTASRATL